MDTYAGDPQTPMSLHKYAYGNLDPALMVDPSGRFSSLGDLMTGIAGRAAISFRALGIRSAKTYLRSAARAIWEASKRIVRDCARMRSKKCKLPINIMFFGDDFYEHTEHIADAIMNGKMPLLLRKKPVYWKPSR